MGKTVCVINLCQYGSVSTGFLINRDTFPHTIYGWLTGASKRFRIPFRKCLEGLSNFINHSSSKAPRMLLIEQLLTKLKLVVVKQLLQIIIYYVLLIQAFIFSTSFRFVLFPDIFQIRTRLCLHLF